MPVATINHSFKRYELKSVEGGWIELRPLSYGSKLERRDRSMNMKLEQEVGSRGKKRSKRNEPEIQKIELQQFSAWSTQFDFEHCVGDHNLTDENGSKLDFSSSMTLKYLDPRIGSELEELLGEINGDLDEDDAEDFTKPPKPSSLTEAT